MPDVFTKAKRSEVMSRIRGRGNADTELFDVSAAGGVGEEASPGSAPCLTAA